MKQLMILGTAFTVYFGFAVNAFADNLFGYPVVETQIRFYSLVIGLIAISVILVCASCLFSRFLAGKEIIKPAGTGAVARLAPAHRGK